jgi:hypothetical protein
VLEDPDYDPLINTRQDFDSNTYYLRRLSPAEITAQHYPRMVYEVMQDLQLSCMYRGKTELITCPKGYVFNGDSLKQVLSIENDGIAWVFHDWMYTTHAFDVRDDGTQTLLSRERRWVVDEMMYTMIESDGYVAYAWIAKKMDTLISGSLDAAWDTASQNPDDACRYKLATAIVTTLLQ